MVGKAWPHRKPLCVRHSPIPTPLLAPPLFAPGLALRTTRLQRLLPLLQFGPSGLLGPRPSRSLLACILVLSSVTLWGTVEVPGLELNLK